MSNPTHPVYTFRINLQTLQRYSWSLPNRTTLDGNETVSEADNQKAARSTWLCNLAPGCNFIVNEHDGTFTAYGQQAHYLKTLYVTGSSEDVLQLVS